MKNTRKFIAGFSAMAMAAAMAMSASAADPTQIVPDDSSNPTPETAGAEVTYNLDPSYIVTIPAGADISSGSDVQSITANDVLLEQGQKITVTLSGASNTESGKLFTAKDESGESTVNYTIKAGDADVAVGDTVAEFETETGEQSATLTFTKDADSTPTYAGKHTETLTFGISVTKTLNIAVYNSTETISFSYTEGQKWTEATTFIDSTQYDSFYDQLVDGNDRGYKPGWYSFEEDGYVAALYLSETTYYILCDNDFNIVDANSVISEESSYILNDIYS